MSLRSRLQNITMRSARAIRAFMESTGPEPKDEFAEPEYDLATLRRIHVEYIVSVGKFVAQREQWKDMFSEWKSHLVAQQMLTRALEQGRREVSALAVLLAQKTVAGIGESSRVALPPFCTVGSAPADAAAAYEVAMNEFGRSADLVPNPEEEKTRVLGWYAAATDLSEGDAIHQSNRELLDLIRRIEQDRDAWKQRHFAQQLAHGAAQAALQDMIGKVGELHGRLLHAVNEHRTKDQQPPITTREELNALVAANQN